jgi:hypothetical protein
MYEYELDARRGKLIIFIAGRHHPSYNLLKLSPFLIRPSSPISPLLVLVHVYLMSNISEVL